MYIHKQRIYLDDGNKRPKRSVDYFVNKFKTGN